MITKRTKQQTACDGVQISWQDDVFTEILHKQAKAPFSMDGIVPIKNTSVSLQKNSKIKINTDIKTKCSQKKVGKCVAGIDGIKMPWKQVTT